MKLSVTAPEAFIDGLVTEIEAWARSNDFWQNASQAVFDRTTGRPHVHDPSYLTIIRESVQEKLDQSPDCKGLKVRVSDELFDDGTITLHVYVQG